MFASIAASCCAICARSMRAFKPRGEYRASLRNSFARRRTAGHQRSSCRQACSRSRQSLPRQPHSPRQWRTSLLVPQRGHSNRHRQPRPSGIAQYRITTRTVAPPVSSTSPSAFRETRVSGAEAAPVHARVMVLPKPGSACTVRRGAALTRLRFGEVVRPVPMAATIVVKFSFGCGRKGRAAEGGVRNPSGVPSVSLVSLTSLSKEISDTAKCLCCNACVACVACVACIPSRARDVMVGRDVPWVKA